MTVLALLVLGCAQLRDAPAPPDPSASFPHPSGFEEGPEHGAPSLWAGVDDCMVCHAKVRPCSDCHGRGFPHVPRYAELAFHGAEVLSDGAAICVRCHDAPGVVSDVPPCQECHASYPHPEGWGDAAQHGRYAVQRGGAIACDPCHVAGASKPPCSECHDYPHPAGFAERAVHGPAWRADPAACATCHGDDGSGGTAQLACSRCHADYPHDPAYLRGHLTPAGIRGAGACMRCHGTGDAGEAMKAPCGGTCHAAAP